MISQGGVKKKEQEKKGDLRAGRKREKEKQVISGQGEKERKQQHDLRAGRNRNKAKTGSGDRLHGGIQVT